MLILNGKEYRSGLGFPCHYTVVLPDAAVRGEASPLILCLHDLGEGREQLLFRAQLPALADELGAALLVPDGRRSCFLDMAHGPAWATFFAEEQVRRMRHDFRIRTDFTGVVGEGAGALGALQICRHIGESRFACALIAPAVDMPFVREPAQWPREQEWKGVFDGQEGQWSPECFRGTQGCVIGTQEEAAHCEERLGLADWVRLEAQGTMLERWSRAISWCLSRNA